MEREKQGRIIEDCVKRYQANLRGYIFSRTGDEQTADDLGQEVFVTAFEKRDTLDHSKDLWPWLLSVARNKLREYWRRKRREVGSATLELLIAGEQMKRDSESEADSVEERLGALRRCVQKLQPQAKRLVEMIYDEARSCVQAAAMLGQQVGTVRVTMHRIRKVLYSCVESEMEGNDR